ncbi:MULTISPECIES: TIGR00730 family Rossman fold protein [unclassified Carboxylicivirga]|uniref:LOG family protein n=1 Tax=Carboxylicivirga TaxID=1628153 RepID=UPI003D353838
MKNVSVFCASSPKVDTCYFDAAEGLAEALVKAGLGVVYGGGGLGLMGALADRALALGGKVKGIIPHFMVEVEWEHKEVKDMLHVQDMAERKKMLVSESDAVVVLAGGVGTLEELFEVLSAKKLGQITHPIILVNTKGFFNPLLDMLQKMIDENFMRPEHGNLLHVVDTPDAVCEALKNLPEWSSTALEFAAVK